MADAKITALTTVDHTTILTTDQIALGRLSDNSNHSITANELAAFATPAVDGTTIVIVAGILSVGSGPLTSDLNCGYKNFSNILSLDNGGGNQIDLNNAKLVNSSQARVDWSNCFLGDFSGNHSLEFGNRRAKATDGTTTTMDWSAGFKGNNGSGTTIFDAIFPAIFDSLGNMAVNIGNLQLIQGGNVIASWTNGFAGNDGAGNPAISCSVRRLIGVDGSTVIATWASNTNLQLNTLTASTALALDGSNNIVSSSTTDVELGYVHGVTSAVQTQINTKAPAANPTFSGTITTPLTASRALATDGSSALAASATTSTELGYLSGVTSAVQTQLNACATFLTGRVTGANATNATTTLTDIAGLTVALLANSVYEFEAHLSVNSSSVTGNDYAVQYSAAGATVEAQSMGILAAGSMQSNRISALNTAAGPYDTAAADGAFFVKGVLTTGANAGNLTIQHATHTAGTATAYKNGSVLTARKIG